MAGLFKLPPRSDRVGDANLIDKIKTKPKAKQRTSKGGNTLMDKIAEAKALIEENFKDVEEKYALLRDEDSVREYFDAIINQGICSIDTEASSKYPMLANIAGFSLYTYGEKAVYIPTGHVSHITGEIVPNQLSNDFMREQLQRLIDEDVFIVMHTADYDICVMYQNCGILLPCHWDCYIASRMLNELEDNHGLKYLHKTYCDPEDAASSFAFGDIFDGMAFNSIPINVGYPYAAHDALITLELYDFQKPFLTQGTEESSRNHLDGVAWVFQNIEMKVLPVIIKMEITGINVDKEYAKELSEKYHKMLEEPVNNINKIVATWEKAIKKYNDAKGKMIIDLPININSPKQVAALLYDVIGVEPTKKYGRSTSVHALSLIKHPICELILKYRGIETLLGTFIDKLPNEANKETGRIHAKFNQVGTDTGRFSSSEPNLQNIPSRKGKEIRQIFRATEGYVLLSSDYSAQEPRLAAHLSKDKKMIKAYKDGKDLYVEIASLVFGVPYDECLEFRKDGTTNPKGKERRNIAKQVVLSVMYGKGIPSLAETIGKSIQEAQEVYDKIMSGFPQFKGFLESSLKFAEHYGYVLTNWGRKRRLPDIQLPPYEILWQDGHVDESFDALDFDSTFESDTEVPEKIVRYWYKQMLDADRMRGRERNARKNEVKERAKAKGICIKDNGGFIAQAKRQTVNSKVQGSAGDQMKLAMILIGNDPMLEDLGFRLLITIHDELVGECPKENKDHCAVRMRQLMIDAAKDLDVPSDCDVACFELWQGPEIELNMDVRMS